MSITDGMQGIVVVEADAKVATSNGTRLLYPGFWPNGNSWLVLNLLDFYDLFGYTAAEADDLVASIGPTDRLLPRRRQMSLTDGQITCVGDEVTIKVLGRYPGTTEVIELWLRDTSPTDDSEWVRLCSLTIGYTTSNVSIDPSPGSSSSSESSDSSSSISSSSTQMDNYLVITGNGNPSPNGIYVRSGLLNGQPCYVCGDWTIGVYEPIDGYWRMWSLEGGAFFYYLQPWHYGDPPIPPAPEGTYTALLNTTGSPVVVLVGELSSSSSDSSLSSDLSDSSLSSGSSLSSDLSDSSLSSGSSISSTTLTSHSSKSSRSSLSSSSSQSLSSISSLSTVSSRSSRSSLSSSDSSRSSLSSLSSLSSGSSTSVSSVSSRSTDDSSQSSQSSKSSRSSLSSISSQSSSSDSSLSTRSSKSSMSSQSSSKTSMSSSSSMSSSGSSDSSDSSASSI